MIKNGHHFHIYVHDPYEDIRVFTKTIDAVGVYDAYDVVEDASLNIETPLHAWALDNIQEGDAVWVEIALKSPRSKDFEMVSTFGCQRNCFKECFGEKLDNHPWIWMRLAGKPQKTPWSKNERQALRGTFPCSK